ncbi:MAG: hypothetical protein M3302_00270, partial [Actinomycetota bacterium]|nr:hypothetical protein [Actinomycetota bacterium]
DPRDLPPARRLSLPGAGTVLTEKQASEAVDAGAEFLVSLGTQEAVVRAMMGTGVAVFAGGLTPSDDIEEVARQFAAAARSARGDEG